MRIKNSEYAETDFSLSTLPDDYKGTVFYKKPKEWGIK